AHFANHGPSLARVKRRQAGSLSQQHVLQEVFAAGPFVVQPARVTHPAGVHGVVLARLVAVNFLFARTDNDVAAGAAARAEAFGFLQKPDAHLEPEILRGERADRAEVDRVQRVIVVEWFAGKMSERVVTAAVDESKRVVPDDVPREPN